MKRSSDSTKEKKAVGVAKKAVGATSADSKAAGAAKKAVGAKGASVANKTTGAAKKITGASVTKKAANVAKTNGAKGMKVPVGASANAKPANAAQSTNVAQSGPYTNTASFSAKQVLHDYRLSRISREMSLLGRKEVLGGKAKFGIFGDGKELPQIALSKVFKNGDFRSGYYRDQTLMMAIGGLTVHQFFAQLYAHPDELADPHSAGRQMNAHFATRLLDEKGHWKPQTSMKMTSADMSPTAGQMPRLLGLAQASKVYRSLKELSDRKDFSRNGNEIAFGTIGDASTSEGVFWETLNAAGVLQVPLVLSVWDDGYGISVAKKYQTTKESISEILAGFQRTKEKPGLEILKVKAWDYTALLQTYEQAAELARNEHVPVVVHVEEVSQPQGHSTSGSHERYKSPERLAWEQEYCCCNQFRLWILSQGLATAKQLDAIEKEAEGEVRTTQKEAWEAFQAPIRKERAELLELIARLQLEVTDPQIDSSLNALVSTLKARTTVIRREVLSTARRALYLTQGLNVPSAATLFGWIGARMTENQERYNTHWISQSEASPLHVQAVPPHYDEHADLVDGRMVLRENFDRIFATRPEVLVFGEDAGQLGDVNLGLEGLQEKYGEVRVADTGIREATILGQGIGMALRGLRPIAEIQYLDYLLYCFQTLSDDLATLRYRTKGGQTAPVIIRTRGHRLEGIWHSGSPMGMIINGVRGVHVCVPRNMTEAAGFYNTLLRGDDPGLIIEPLNGYRLKERMPSNPGEYTTPLGIPEIVHPGQDITLVSYGSTFNVVEAALPLLSKAGISAELIDVRTLLPFDREHRIVESLAKTNRIVFIDEDVPGGATAFMMQQVLDVQGGYQFLDAPARCLSAQPHRPPYASDGDYFSKPSVEDVFETVYEMMREARPAAFPKLG